MFLRLLFLGSIACAQFVVTGPAWALTAAEVFSKVAPSVWQVRTYDTEGLPMMTGSSVVIAPETLVTNCHVLRKATRFSLVRDKVVHPAVLVLWDTERDLCQIRAAGLVAPAVQIGDVSGVTVGQSVFALGNPLGLDLTLSAGLVSNLRLDDAKKLRAIQISAPISPGSSGGGLFDDQARLIGLTSSEAIGGQNINFALPASWIAELPQRQALHTASSTASSTVATSPARFDGNWKVAVSCPALPSGAAGYRFEFQAQVQDSHLQGRYLPEGSPGSMLLQGSIGADGRSVLVASGVTGDPRFNYDHASAMNPYSYHVEAQFDAIHGSGRRVEARQCGLAFARL
jgi:serine protease Do